VPRQRTDESLLVGKEQFFLFVGHHPKNIFYGHLIRWPYNLISFFAIEKWKKEK